MCQAEHYQITPENLCSRNWKGSIFPNPAESVTMYKALHRTMFTAAMQASWDWCQNTESWQIKAGQEDCKHSLKKIKRCKVRLMGGNPLETMFTIDKSSQEAHRTKDTETKGKGRREGGKKISSQDSANSPLIFSVNPEWIWILWDHILGGFVMLRSFGGLYLWLRCSWTYTPLYNSE